MHTKVTELLIAHDYAKRKHVAGYKKTIVGRTKTMVVYFAPKEMQYYIRINGETKWQTVVRLTYDGYDEFINLYLVMQSEVKSL